MDDKTTVHLVSSYFLCTQVYLYREGFARFTNATFSLDKEDLSNAYIHLTNHAVQKKDADYDAAKSDLKWSIHSLKTFLSSMHGQEASNTCFGKIQHIITQVCSSQIFFSLERAMNLEVLASNLASYLV